MNSKTNESPTQCQNRPSMPHSFAASSPLVPPARMSVLRSADGKWNAGDAVYLWENDPKFTDDPGDDLIPVNIVEFLPAHAHMPERVVVARAGVGITVPVRRIARSRTSAELAGE